MSYTPLSNAFYLALAGFDSAMAAGGRPVTSTEDATYDRQALAAFAFAREFDTQWGATEPDFLETYMIPVCTEAYWRGRDDGSVDPAHYEQTAAEIIAIIREADAIASAGGATPPAAPGGGLALMLTSILLPGQPPAQISASYIAQVDARSGPVPLLAPLNPVGGQVFGVRDIFGVFTLNPCNVTAQGAGITILDLGTNTYIGASTLVGGGVGQAYYFQFDAFLQKWEPA